MDVTAPIVRHAGATCPDRDCVSYPTWYCAQSPPNEEFRAFRAISEAGFSAHLPRRLLKRRNYGRIQQLVRPLFATYLFIQFDVRADPWGAILRLPGVRRMLRGADGQPEPLRLGVVEAIQKRGRAGDGVIDDEAAAFPVGDPLRIVDGPFREWTGVCQWSTDEAVGVLMTLFGREKVVEVPRAQVVAL
jgi:transcription antitermination factor NusG